MKGPSLYGNAMHAALMTQHIWQRVIWAEISYQVCLHLTWKTILHVLSKSTFDNSYLLERMNNMPASEVLQI
jgi:hypothetical protein